MVISVQNVTRRYGHTTAVNGVSFDVAQGEVVGFLGPNGAGKSTVLKMISTWLPPTAGRITVASHDVEREPLAVRRVLGYLAEHNALYENMRVDRFFGFLGRVRGMDPARLTGRMAWVVEKCGLETVWRKRIHQCSKGYRQRIGLGAALLHDPPVILLDEPTHGLDALQVVAFRDFIHELREGRAILFSSHILAEVIAICDRLLIINDGRLLANTPVEKLVERSRSTGVELEAMILEIVRRGGDQR